MSFWSSATIGIANQGQIDKYNLHCPYDGELLIYYENDDFHICSFCGCEVWPDSGGISLADIHQVMRQEIYRPHKSGGGGSSGKKRKKPPKREDTLRKYRMG